MGGGRAECRNSDSSCNPYLAAALLLAAGLEGVREKLDPGAPHDENLYELSPAQLAEAGVVELPRTLGEAVELFERDAFVRETLGQELQEEFVRYKRAEWEQYHQSVSQWEIDRYARLF
jgi:glutamine synthetase